MNNHDIWVAAIHGGAPTLTVVVTWLLNRRQMRQQDSAIKEVRTAVNGERTAMQAQLDEALAKVARLEAKQ